MANDTIVIKAPAGTKARWVRQSQAASMKLGDWIVRRVEGWDAEPAREIQSNGAASVTIPPHRE